MDKDLCVQILATIQVKLNFKIQDYFLVFKFMTMIPPRTCYFLFFLRIKFSFFFFFFNSNHGTRTTAIPNSRRWTRVSRITKFWNFWFKISKNHNVTIQEFQKITKTTTRRKSNKKQTQDMSEEKNFGWTVLVQYDE